MSWMASAWVKKSRLGSGPRKGVMLVVADYCTESAAAIHLVVEEGWSVCWAGVDTIAAEAEFSERTVRRVLDDMEAAGVIRRERRNDDRGYRTYDLIWLQHGRRFVDLTGPDESDRPESPVGASGAVDEPVDNAGDPPVLPDSQARLPVRLSTPTGQAVHPYKEEPPTELPTNRQDHLGKVTHDRATPNRETRSLRLAAAPPARARPPPGADRTATRPTTTPAA